jgi:hypothetical protein
MEQVVQIGVTGLLVARMIDAGFRPPVGRVFSWPMYAYALAVVVDITIADSESVPERKINPYLDFPRGEFLVPPDQLDLYLSYLRRKHAVVRCSGTAYGLSGETELKVVDGHVAVAGA